MRFPRRLSGRLLAIICLIALSVITIISIGEGFKVFLDRKDVSKLEKRDGSATITLNMPWEPVKVDAKDILQDEDNLIGDIAAVASAILGGAARVATAASAGAVGLEGTPLPASVPDDGSADSSSVIQEVSGQVQQATSIVAAVIGDATSIVGSILAAATSPSNIGVLPIGKFNSSMSGNGTLLSSASSAPMSSSGSQLTVLPNTTIFALPCASSAMVSATIELTAAPSELFCPTTVTETCTVTETWHSTHYAETATFYSFVANSTITYTETASGCPSPLYLADPTTAFSPLQGLIACADGVLAKRQQDCPYNMAASATASSSIHPCPGSGYSCGACPDGWFCPPYPTPPQSCACGFGWACADCKDGCFCVPGPTSTGNGVNTVTSLLTTSMPLLESVATGPATLQSLGTMVPMSTGTVTCVDGSVVMLVNECLNGVGATPIAGLTSINTITGGLLSTAKADISPLLGNAQAASNLPTQLIPKTTTPILATTNPTALSDITKLMLAGVPTNIPAANPQPAVVGLGSVPAVTIPVLAVTSKVSNAAENLFNQLINGSPTSLVVSTPTIELRPAPVLGIA